MIEMEPGSYLFRGTDRTSGRATALTVLTPLPRLWAGLLAAILHLRRRLGPDRGLQRLSFIHFAHWSVIRSFPGQQRRSKYAYLLFRSDFNGAWGKYIDAFSVAIPSRMALIWGWSFGFPGALPPRPFREYIARNDLDVAHYWSAYPGASVTEVAAALRCGRAFDEQLRPLLDGDPATFQAAWQKFIQSEQAFLYAWEEPE